MWYSFCFTGEPNCHRFLKEKGLSYDSDDETGEDSEVNISTTVKSKKKNLFLDSDSQENNSERCQATEKSSMYDSSGKSYHSYGLHESWKLNLQTGNR